MIKYILVVLKLAGLTTLQIIQKAQFIVRCMTGNAYFTTPSPALAGITAAITALENAELDVLNHVRGAVQVRDSKLKALKTLLEKERQYVEDTANATPEIAEAIAYSAGMEVKLTGGKNAQVFSVKNSILPGMLELFAPSFRGATYIWMMSETPADERSWTQIGLTHQAHFVKSGLNSGTKYYFKVGTLGVNNMVIWSFEIYIIVL